MWFDKLDRTMYIKKLYNVVPELKNIKILKIELEICNDKIRLSICIPVKVDKPPIKWNENNYIYPIIEIDLFSIKNFNLESLKKINKSTCNIFFDKDLEDNLVILCEGEYFFKITSECGIIQNIRGTNLEL